MSAVGHPSLKGHGNPHYVGWRAARQRKLVEILGSDLSGLSVIELGCGLGHMGGFLADLGAMVLGLEGRHENVLRAQQRAGLTNYAIELWDVRKDFTPFGRFDLALSLGLIEVVHPVEDVLLWSAAVADWIILDTLVCDSADAKVVQRKASRRDDDALDGAGSRPTAAFIERFHVERGFRVTRHWTSDLNSGPHVYDWQPANDGDCVSGKRRLWEFKREIL